MAEKLIIGKGERGHAPFTAVFFFPSRSLCVYSSFKEASSLTSIPFLFFRSFLDDGMQVTWRGKKEPGTVVVVGHRFEQQNRNSYSLSFFFAGGWRSLAVNLNRSADIFLCTRDGYIWENHNFRFRFLPLQNFFWGMGFSCLFCFSIAFAGIPSDSGMWTDACRRLGSLVCIVARIICVGVFSYQPTHSTRIHFVDYFWRIRFNGLSPAERKLFSLPPNGLPRCSQGQSRESAMAPIIFESILILRIDAVTGRHPGVDAVDRVRLDRQGDTREFVVVFVSIVSKETIPVRLIAGV